MEELSSDASISDALGILHAIKKKLEVRDNDWQVIYVFFFSYLSMLRRGSSSTISFLTRVYIFNRRSISNSLYKMSKRILITDFFSKDVSKTKKTKIQKSKIRKQ